MSVAAEIRSSLGAYLRAQLRNAILVGGLYIIGYAIAGVPWWMLTGFIAALLNPIPGIGSLLALGVGLLAKALVVSDWIPLLYVCAAWLVIQVIDGFVLSPRAAGHAGVNPFLSILITLAAGLVLGPIGMLFAVPVVAVVFIIVRAARSARRIRQG